ncbi:MAG: glycosyltransferase [Bacteroidales bacterium]|nr:glycosyltransferase [Bacteroidales bacterium]
MKIILIGTAYPYRGGLASFNERLMSQFQNEADEVEIKTFTLQYPSILFPGKTQFSSSENLNNFPIERCVNSINPLNWIKVGRKIKRENPDIVIIKYWMPFMSPCFGTMARLIKSNKKTKIIAIADNIIPHERRFFDSWLTKYFVGCVDAWIAMSQSVFDDIKTFDKTTPCKLCFHPIFDNFGEKIDKATAQKILDLKSKEINILFFGLVRDYKGLDILIKALKNPDLEKYPLHLTVAGEFYEPQEKYDEIISQLGLKNITIHNKFIANEEVKNYFCACDLVVLPYKTATQSGVTQIAYHFEKPMLVTDVGGLSEIVKHGKSGYVCQPNVEALSKTLIDFCENRPDFRESLMEEKKKFSWEEMTKSIKALYNKILIQKNDNTK